MVKARLCVFVAGFFGIALGYFQINDFGPLPGLDSLTGKLLLWCSHAIPIYGTIILLVSAFRSQDPKLLDYGLFLLLATGAWLVSLGPFGLALLVMVFTFRLP